MSKYELLWNWIQEYGTDSFKLTFDEIEKIAGIPIGHSFLNDKKELLNYGYKAGKISLKGKTVSFEKVQGNTDANRPNEQENRGQKK